jgi:threonine/homoserine/homoserine lactone efflux protein
MLTALLLGISYGFTAGISPGPMLGLVITQTLQRGWRAGNLVALAPLITDLPIVTLAILLIGHLPAGALNWLALIGGLFVVYLSLETGRTALRLPKEPARETSLPSASAVGSVLWRAVITNALNPHPYLFWGTVGAQLLIRRFESDGLAAAALLLVSFYVLLVGTKLLVAFAVNHSRGWLHGPAYRRVLLASALLLLALGIWLLSEGLTGLL